MGIEEIFSGVFKIDGKLATKNLTPGYTVYGERTMKIEGEEYRFWDPYRSKLGAAIMLGLKELPIESGDNILYLGAANGTTPSHMSDIVGSEGLVFCVEFAPRSMRDLIPVCEKKQNMLPILADARKPMDYRKYIDAAECLYEDVAQPDQDEILIKNARQFLKKGGCAMLAIKSQSVDVTKEPEEIYRRVLEKLGKHFKILESYELSPFDKDHLFVVMRYMQGH